jgi:heme-degrading monooxygenase HmoA
MKQLLAAISLTLLATPFAHAQQMMGDYLDVTIVKVRPEKRADFDAIAHRIADANQKAKGDYWTAMQVEYGENNTVQIASPRQSYASIETGMSAFMGAIKTAYGTGGFPKMMADLNNTILSSRSELRQRRWDLTVNPPTDMDAYQKLIGEARWFRTIRIEVRNGHEADFEERAKEAKSALEKGSKWTFFISQVIAGAPGNVYYVSTPQPSLAAFDSAPKLSELMSQEAFSAWMKGVADVQVTSETTMTRLMPELSNVPEGIAKAAPDFWQPKHAPAAAHVIPKSADTARNTQQSPGR